MSNDCENCKEVLERITELEENLEKAEQAIECLRMFIRGVQHGLRERPTSKPVGNPYYTGGNSVMLGG